MSQVFNSNSYTSYKETPAHAMGSYYKKDRLNLLTPHVASSMNSYRNWKSFDMTLAPILTDIKNKKEVYKILKGKGIKSLFSNTMAVHADADESGLRMQQNMPLMDSPTTRKELRKKTHCSIKTLVDESSAGNMGSAIYNYADFMYCKHLGKIPNNQMITLRKFPSGCGDHINYSSIAERTSGTNEHLPDMGRLVTWMGVDGNDMSNLLKYTYKLPWQENKAPMNEPPNQRMGQAGSMGKMMAMLDSGYAKSTLSGHTDVFFFNGKGVSEIQGSYDYPDWEQNKVISSLQNTIQKVTVAGGRQGGLEFDQDLKLTFNYELRSYDGINPRSAFLDLISNILVVTYMQGKLFKGSYRGVKSHTTNAFANLPIWNDSASGKITGPSSLLDSTWSSVMSIKDQFSSGEGDKNSLQAIKGLAQNLFQGFLGGMLNKIGRPEKFVMTSLLTPAPTGQWHVTIGNPRNPIMSMGNMILKDANITHYGPLGLDDFPTGLKVEVTLGHAKPRDSVGIEQMYMQGDGRIYTPMGKDIQKMYDGAIKYKSYADRPHANTAAATLAQDPSKGADKADINEVKLTSEIPLVQKDKDIYNRFFGTNKQKLIKIVAMEAFTGSDKQNPTPKPK